MNNNLERLALVEGALSCSVSTLRKIAIEDPTAEYSGKVARETLLLIDKLVNAQGAATRPAEQGQPAIGAPVPLSTAEQKVFRKTIGLVTTRVDAISLARHLRETDDIEHITRKEIMLLVKAILEMDSAALAAADKGGK